ncbi:MAG: hypothetical protein P8N60_03420 [Burkholderiaceae bacterium]|jgi:hypothetical protein|nr:hypothetical protein [Burkholderiaceae bacterium]
MHKQPNTIVVRDKYLKLNIGLDPETGRRLTSMIEQLLAAGFKKPSISLVIRYALRDLSSKFHEEALDYHFDRLKALV